MRYLRQSTSADVPIGPFVDSTDGVSPETALTITQPDVRLKKNGAAWAQKAAAQTLSHQENGMYQVTLDATDTNTVGNLRLHVNETGALPVWDDFTIIQPSVYDPLFSNSGNLQVNVIQWIAASVNALISGKVDATTADLTAAMAALTNIQGRLPVDLSTGRLRVDMEAMNGDTEAVIRLRRGVRGNVLFAIGNGSTTTSLITEAIFPTPTVADQYRGRILTFDIETTTTHLRGQVTNIIASTVGGVLSVGTVLTHAPVFGDIATIT